MPDKNSAIRSVAASLDGAASQPIEPPPRPSLKLRWVARRNAIFASRRFQYWCARLPFIRRVARNRATAMFDHIVGFSYAQILKAAVECGLLDILKDGPVTAGEVAKRTDLSLEAALCLLRASRGLNLAEEPEADQWMLGQQGAVLAADEGTKAMITHHRLLYSDLADPLGLLRQDRAHGTQLSQFWSYAGALHGAANRGEETAEYSKLMAASQAYVADQVLAACSFAQVRSLLDVGGGHGAFLARVGAAHRDLRVGLFDLPEVAEGARAPLCQALDSERVQIHSGSFFDDPLPTGYDMVSLVRILHDHDDEPAQQILAAIHASLTPGKRLLIAEPMARIKGAEPMGEAFFGMYLWAMGSGRARSPKEITAMLKSAGFAKVQHIASPQPVIASILVATA